MKINRPKKYNFNKNWVSSQKELSSRDEILKSAFSMIKTSTPEGVCEFFASGTQLVKI